MPDEKPFVHLHVHTEYSLLDGLSHIKKLVKRAQEVGMNALAITDHGTMFGVIDFYRACIAANIKPIIGMEAYLAPRGMEDRDPQRDTKPYHLLLLARNQTGYQNLLQIASAAQLHGYYYRPRVDHDFLAEHAEGLIATSGCLAAEIPRLVERGQDEDALQKIGWYREVFGAENFFLELQHHDIPILHTLNRWLVENRGYANIPLVATNDVHYIREEDYDAHDTLLCIQTGNLKTEPNRLHMSDPSYHLRTPDEMWRLFADVPEALYTSLQIADMCDVTLDSKGYHLPVFPVPEGYTADTYLRSLCERGLRWRYGSRADTDAALRERLDYELGIIHSMGFDTYFLIVWDLCEFARHADIWWNVRGSGAGSVAAYSLGITSIDPLQNGLLFERFLNPGRVSMPDIDMDFPEDRRAEMIQYCAQKYGEDKVAAIITFGTMGSKAAIRDVGRALDMPIEEVNRIARLIPTAAKAIKFDDALGDDPEKALPDLKAVYEQDAAARKVIDVARQLEGVTRHASTHAAGIIVADRPLVEYIPLHRPTSGSDDDAPVKQVTQFPMETCESIGLLKVDFLGLSTLTIVRLACDLIEQQHGVRYDLSNIPYRSDPANPEQARMIAETFEMLSRGETIGVFQLESQGMRRMLTDMRPRKFENIVAAVALYRPGPMEYIPTYNRRLHGDEQITYLHPLLEPILGETYGICVSGDSLVFDTITGQRHRVDQLADKVGSIAVQGVDENYRPAIGRVTHLIDNGEKPVYRVMLRNGAAIKTTADHRFLTEDGWKPLNEIRAGEYVATPPHLIAPDAPAVVDRDRLRALAYLIADGSLASGCSVDFVGQDPVLLDEYVRCLEAFGDVTPVYTEQARGVQRVGVRHKTHYKVVNSLLAWMREMGFKYPPGRGHPRGVRSQEKFIPDFVFTLGNDDVAFFLASLWDCDGHASPKTWHYKTISQRLAQDVQTLLLRVGISSVIHHSTYESIRGHRDAYQVTVHDTRRLSNILSPYLLTHKKDVVCAAVSQPTLDRLRFVAAVHQATDRSSRQLMADYGIDRVHFYRKATEGRPRIPARVVAPVAEALDLVETQRAANVIWQEVTSIEAEGVERVYDLTVEGIHNFVANNIIVHNCVFQEQIMQIGAELFGYSLGEADLMRKAVSKKKKEDLLKHRETFIQRGPDHGVDPDSANKIFDDIEFFARYGFNKCLPEDVEVIDAATGRLVRIGDLASGAASIEHTLTCDTDRLRLQPGVVTHVHANGVKPVYRLTTQSGRQIEATANHPFYTFGGWRQLGDLTIGEPVAVPRRLPVDGRREWTDHAVIVLGHLLAEGNLCHPHGAYYYTTDDEQLADYVAHLERFDNTTASISRHKSAYSVYSRRSNRDVEAGVVTWLKSLGIRGKTAHTKEIPSEVFELSNRQIALLLARMWEGDGHINEKGRSLFYATASERLARQVQHLLLRLGILSHLRTVIFPYKEGRTGYQVFVTGNENMAAFLDQIGQHFVSDARREKLGRMVAAKQTEAAGTRDVVPVQVKELVRAYKSARGLTWDTISAQAHVAPREFYVTSNATKSGFSRPVIGRLAEFFDADDLRAYANGDIYWDKVVAIEYVGDKPTYDLTVADTHNFVANDFIVHNSHAADYAVLTCQTAFLKCHYPHEYMTALMTVHRDDSAKVSLFAADCSRMNIEVLPPNVNASKLNFSIEAQADGQRAIRFGLAAIKNVGVVPLEHIIAQREMDGPFRDLEDFCRRADLRIVQKRALESLIRVGALDQFGTRPTLLAAMDRMIRFSADYHKAQDVGQISLFGDATGVTFDVEQSLLSNLPDIEQASRRDMLRWEKELVGLYVTDHPLRTLEAQFASANIKSSADLIEEGDAAHGKPVQVAGLVTDIRNIVTKKGEPMAILTLEDIAGTLSVVMFPRTWEKYREIVSEDAVLVVRGKADTGRGDVQVIADEVRQEIETVEAVEEMRQLDAMRLSWLNETPPGETSYDDETGEPDAPEPAPAPRAEAVMPATAGANVAPIPPVEPPSAPRSRTYEEPPHFGPLVSDREMPGWLETELDNGWTPAPALAYQDDTGHVIGVLEPENGNGHAQDSTDAPVERAAPPPLRPRPRRPRPDPKPPAEPQPGRLLKLTIPRSGDSARDRARMRRLHGILTQYPGPDRFCFLVQGQNQKQTRMDFPKYPIAINDEVLELMRQMVGAENVQIEMLE